MTQAGASGSEASGGSPAKVFVLLFGENDVAQGEFALGHRADLLPTAAAVRDENSGAAVGEEEAAGPRRIDGVQRHRNETVGHGGHVRTDVMHAVGQENPDAVARFQAERGEASPPRVDAGCELRVRDGLPLSALSVVLPKGFPWSPRLAGGKKEFRQGVLAVQFLCTIHLFPSVCDRPFPAGGQSLFLL